VDIRQKKLNHGVRPCPQEANEKRLDVPWRW